MKLWSKLKQLSVVTVFASQKKQLTFCTGKLSFNIDLDDIGNDN